MKLTRRLLLAGGAGVTGLAAGAGLLMARRGPSEPEFDKRAFLRTNRFPDTVLVDHTGRTRRFYTDLLKDRKVVINFMYASCSRVCELSSQVMARLQADFATRGENVMLYSISVDPERDSPQNLAEYRAQFTAQAEGWTFLTARGLQDVTALRRSLGVYEPDEGQDQDITNHTGLLILGNETTGRWATVPSQVHPVRIRQAVDRMMLPPEQWARGEELITAVPRPAAR